MLQECLINSPAGNVHKKAGCRKHVLHALTRMGLVLNWVRRRPEKSQAPEEEQSLQLHDVARGCSCWCMEMRYFHPPWKPRQGRSDVTSRRQYSPTPTLRYCHRRASLNRLNIGYDVAVVVVVVVIVVVVSSPTNG